MKNILETVWDEHMKNEFMVKDAEATMKTMTDNPSVRHVPVNTGGQGRDAVLAFYRDEFIPSFPDDINITPTNRIVTDRFIVEELRFSMVHSKQIDWFLPGVPPTNKKIEVELVVVIEFEQDKIKAERIYWDQATVLRQIGLLKN